MIDENGNASLCDFGLSLTLDGGPTGYTSSDFGGSLRYLAPELLESTVRTTATDMYALGCTCMQVRWASHRHSTPPVLITRIDFVFQATIRRPHG